MAHAFYERVSYFLWVSDRAEHLKVPVTKKKRKKTHVTREPFEKISAAPLFFIYKFFEKLA